MLRLRNSAFFLGSRNKQIRAWRDGKGVIACSFYFLPEAEVVGEGEGVCGPGQSRLKERATLVSERVNPEGKGSRRSGLVGCSRWLLWSPMGPSRGVPVTPKTCPHPTAALRSQWRMGTRVGGLEGAGGRKHQAGLGQALDS